MKRVLVNFDEATLRAAERTAKRIGISRSEAIRRAVVQAEGTTVAVETGAERRARMRAAFDGLRAAGRRIKAVNPEWDPIALIRASREGRIRL